MNPGWSVRRPPPVGLRRTALTHVRPPCPNPEEPSCQTSCSASTNGGGFLTDRFPDAYKAIWDFSGQVATSRHIRGVRYTEITTRVCSAPPRRRRCWLGGTRGSVR